MAYVPYEATASSWNNIHNEPYGKRFYPLQSGQGSSIQLVSPAQGSVLRAKSDLKRQLSESNIHSPPRKQRKKTKEKIQKNKTKKKKTKVKVKGKTKRVIKKKIKIKKVIKKKKKK